MLEIPAGMRDIAGEDTEAVARRELVEEAGLQADRVELLTEILPSPGMTDSVTTLYLATGCTAVPHDRQGPEEEHMQLLHLPLADAIEMVDRGEIADAKSVVALLLTERRLRAARSSRDLSVGTSAMLPIEVEEFLSWMVAEKGRAPNTVAAYRPRPGCLLRVARGPRRRRTRRRSHPTRRVRR